MILNSFLSQANPLIHRFHGGLNAISKWCHERERKADKTKSERALTPSRVTPLHVIQFGIIEISGIFSVCPSMKHNLADSAKPMGKMTILTRVLPEVRNEMSGDSQNIAANCRSIPCYLRKK
jgi:hypothetical protein